MPNTAGCHIYGYFTLVPAPADGKDFIPDIVLVKKQVKPFGGNGKTIGNLMIEQVADFGNMRIFSTHRIGQGSGNHGIGKDIVLYLPQNPSP